MNNKKNPSINIRNLRTRYTYILIALLILSDSLFGIINVDVININGIFNVDIVWQLFAISYITYVYIRHSNEFKITFRLMNICILVLLLSCFISAFQSYILTGQPYMRGILPQRTFIISLLYAYLLQPLINTNLIDINRIFNCILVIGTVVGIAYIFQFFSGVEIFHVLQNERYGSTRLYAHSCFPNMAGFIGFWRFLKTTKLKYILPSIVPIFLSVFVSKGRLELVALIATYLVLFFVVRRRLDFKIFLFLFFVICIIGFSCTPYGKRLLYNFIFVNAESNTMLIRAEGRELYSSQLNESVINRIFGCGYPNALYAPASMRAGLDRGIILGDNGIFAFTYVHGVLGFVTILCVTTLILFYSFKRIHSESGLFCFSFACFNIFTCSNITWWWFSDAWPMFFALVVSCSISKIKDA